MTNNESIGIESFINFCNDLEIVQEGAKNGIQSVLKSIRNAFTKIGEFFRRLAINLKSKMNGHKFFVIPQEYHNSLRSLSDQIIDSILDMDRKGKVPFDIDDRIDDYEKRLNELRDKLKEQKHKQHNKNNAHIQAAIVYTDILDASKDISNTLSSIIKLGKKWQILQMYRNIVNN